MGSVVSRLTKNQRHDRILHLLQIKPVVLISELANEFKVSIETIRRDIDLLAELSLLQRTHGGAASISTAKEGGLNQRRNMLPEERMKLAKEAAHLVSDGQVLMFDSSATCTFLASRLAIEKKELTVITNSFAIAIAISENPTHQIIMLPGKYRASEGSVYGIETIEAVRKFNADHCFSSAGAISREGITEYNQDVSALKSAMIERARQFTLLADHSKFGLGKLQVVCDFSKVDNLFTDQPIPNEMKADLKRHQVNVQVVKQAQLKSAF